MNKIEQGIAQAVARALVSVLLVCPFGLTGCNNELPVSQSQSEKPPAISTADASSDKLVQVRTTRPVREHLKRLSTPQPAHVGPYEKTDIYSKVAGFLESYGQIQTAPDTMRPIDIGDRVEKNQVLAKLAIPEMEQERIQKKALVDQAEAEVGQAEAAYLAAEAMVEAAQAKLEENRSQVARYEAELAFRRGEHDRYVSLVKERAVRQELVDEKLNLLHAAMAALKAAQAALISDQANIKVEQAKLTKAKADVTSAKARLRVAQANHEQTVILLNYAIIRAPYDGILTRRLADRGAFIQSAATGRAEPLFTIAQVDRLRIISDIPEAEAGLVKLGQRASLRIDSLRGQVFVGKVVRFADSLDSGTRTMRTEVELDSFSKTLRTGMFGSLTIIIADVPDALILPANAILGGDKPGVFILHDGVARRRDVEVGLFDAGRVQILAGLNGTETVILNDKVLVREGQTVELAP